MKIAWEISKKNAKAGAKAGIPLKPAEGMSSGTSPGCKVPPGGGGGVQLCESDMTIFHNARDRRSGLRSI